MAKRATERRAAARAVSGVLDAALRLAGKIPLPLYLVAAAVAAISAFPFDPPSSKTITGATLDTRIVVWAMRVAAMGVGLLIVAAGFFALRSIAAYIETGRWVKTAGSVGVEDTSEALRAENQGLRNQLSKAQTRLQQSDNAVRELQRELKAAREASAVGEGAPSAGDDPGRPTPA